MPLKLTTYYHGKDIPDLPGNNTFHSKELFQIYEATPGYSPLLIVATEDGKPVARLLAAIRKTKKWLPSCLVKQCVVYGKDIYSRTERFASEHQGKRGRSVRRNVGTSHARGIPYLYPYRIPQSGQLYVRLPFFPEQRLFSGQLVTGTQFVT